jgi:hypothetical protein
MFDKRPAGAEDLAARAQASASGGKRDACTAARERHRSIGGGAPGQNPNGLCELRAVLLKQQEWRVREGIGS